MKFGIHYGCLMYVPVLSCKTRKEMLATFVKTTDGKATNFYVKVPLNNKPVPSRINIALNRSLLHVKIHDYSITQRTDCQLRSMAAR